MSFNLNLINPKVGQQVRLQGQQYSLGLPLPDGRLSLTNIATGVVLFMTSQELSSKYMDGFLEHVDHPVTTAFVAKRRLNLLDLSAATDDEKKEVRRKQMYVDTLATLDIKTYQPTRFTQAIETIAAQIGDKKPPTHWTLQRWCRDWQKSQGDPRIFLPQTARRGNRRLRWPQELLKLAGDVATSGLLTKQQHTVTKFYKALELAVVDANRFREPRDQLTMPSEGSIRRFCDRIDPFEFRLARTSRKAADRTYKQYGRGVKTTRILERVEIDHTILDLFVIDSERKIILGRPTLTVVIDAHSRAVLSFYVSFGPPSWVAVMEALKRAILPKNNLKEVYPDIHNAWECFGLPETIVSDNGREFVSINFEDAAHALNIQIQFCPPHEPWFKAKIERFMRTINQGIIHSLPGTTFGKQYRIPDYDPTKHASIDFDDLTKIIHMWVVDIYMQEYHSGIQNTPAAMWREEAAKTPPRLPSTRRDLDIALGIVEERSLHHYGIEANGQLFNCQALSLIRARLEKPERRKNDRMAKVKIKLLAEDISGIFLRDPITDEYLWVPNTDQEYAKGKGWHQHKIIQQYARTTGKGNVDKKQLLIAEAKIARQISAAVKRGGGKRGNKNIARFENVAQPDFQNDPAAVAERSGQVDVPPHQSDDEPVIHLLAPTPLPDADDGWEVSSN
jgi:putative transposase